MQLNYKRKLQVDQTVVVKTGSTYIVVYASARTIVTMCMENVAAWTQTSVDSVSAR